MKKSWRCAVPPAATAFLLALSFLFLLPARPAASQEEGGGPAPPPRTPPPGPSGGVLVSGHPRATRVGTAVLLGGGNAFDAGVAAAMALAALQEGGAGWGGAAPLVLYSARDAEAMSRTGVGPRRRAPRPSAWRPPGEERWRRRSCPRTSTSGWRSWPATAPAASATPSRARCRSPRGTWPARGTPGWTRRWEG